MDRPTLFYTSEIIVAPRLCVWLFHDTVCHGVLLFLFVLTFCYKTDTYNYDCDTYLDSVLVEVGQWVSAGDILGTVGNTGGSYGYPDQCGIYVMQDGLMVDPTLFFDVTTQPTKWPIYPGDPGWPDGF